jgi:hypothetical protein
MRIFIGMKILVNKNQYKKLINEISLLDVIKQADESDILSLEIPDTTNSLNLKLTRQAMENVLKRGVSELEKYIESPEEYIKSLAIEEIPQEIPQLPEEPPTPPEKLESPQIQQKIKEIGISQEYLDELTSKKGYKSRRDRDNIDLLKINIARLNRDLNKLRNISESKNLIKRILKEHSWQRSDDDKWNSLEKDLRYVVERLIERHKDNFGGDQYEVMGAIEQVFDGMFQKVSITEQRDVDNPELEETGETGGIEKNVMDRLRMVFEQIKKLPPKAIELYIPEIHDNGTQQGGNGRLIDGLNGILKLVGGGTAIRRGGEAGPSIITYWFIKAFLVNGGFNRNFKEGEITLPVVTIYECQADFVEEVFESRTSWGNVIGPQSEEEAIEWYSGNMHNWEEDTEHQDSEYGDITGVEDVIVSSTQTLKFHPEWIGWEV